ncbi:MAG TPA: hypothetical protein VH234_00410 [Candidatus Saccharimonadales bacterium]|jgi:hypothetical protein|nr:hypothetical protein [Candidatus Saccharimonadales bacterium]
MKPTKYKKQQDDRLLKRLTPRERRQQELLRQLIVQDELFKTV